MKRQENGLKLVIAKKIGAAIAPAAIAKGSKISQHIKQQQQLLIYLANAQGATIIPIAHVNAIPITNMTTSPMINMGTSKHSPIKANTAQTLGTSSVSLKNNRFVSPSTH